MTGSAARRPTMIDVAREAGVSFKTVSRVVNGVESVDPAMTARVLDAIEKLGFRRNTVAANLRSGSDTATIGLIIGDVSNAFYSTMLAAIAGVADEHNTLVISASAEEDPATQRRLAIDLCQRRVNGLIIVPAGDDHSYLDAEIRLGTPMVFIDRPPTGVVADVFLIENRSVAREAAELLLAEGHERIAVVLDELGIYTMRERLAGIEEAFAAVGRTLDPELLATTAHDPASTAAAVRGMLESPRPPTAYVAGNNRATVGVIEELWRDGLFARVVGFDDFEVSHLMPRRVTIVDYDLAELARAAARRLFERISGSIESPRHHYQPTRFVDRGLQP